MVAGHLGVRRARGEKLEKSMYSLVETPPARKRISKACNYCRQRKIKCNGDIPCLNCKTHHIDCIYSESLRKKKRHTQKKLTIQELEKRLNDMTRKYDTINNKLNDVLHTLAQNNLMKVEKRQYDDGMGSEIPDIQPEQYAYTESVGEYDDDHYDNDDDSYAENSSAYDDETNNEEDVESPVTRNETLDLQQATLDFDRKYQGDLNDRIMPFPTYTSSIKDITSPFEGEQLRAAIESLPSGLMQGPMFQPPNEQLNYVLE